MHDKRIHRFVREISNFKHWNYIMLDFVDYYPNIVNYVLGLNFISKIIIRKAKVVQELENSDVTDRLKEIMVGGNSLWILSWKHDLGIELRNDLSNHLYIEYSIDDRALVHTISITISEEKDFLLNTITLKSLITSKDTKQEKSPLDLNLFIKSPILE